MLNGLQLSSTQSADTRTPSQSTQASDAGSATLLGDSDSKSPASAAHDAPASAVYTAAAADEGEEDDFDEEMCLAVVSAVLAVSPLGASFTAEEALEVLSVLDNALPTVLAWITRSVAAIKAAQAGAGAGEGEAGDAAARTADTRTALRGVAEHVRALVRATLPLTGPDEAAGRLRAALDPELQLQLHMGVESAMNRVMQIDNAISTL